MAAEVKVYEEKLTVPTYTVGPAAKNPTILIEGHQNIYPYTLMDDIFQGKEDKAYRSLTLENEYLKISVFPELGGHIWSAYDKVAKREMFYKNDAVKPGLILLRGSWCAYGLEFNFPCGHTVTTMSEIDSYIRKNKDGSGSIFVSDVEMVSRMKWLVEIRLYPGEADFRTNVRLMNGTEVARRYYFWSNAGVKATDDFQFMSPATESAPSWSPNPHPFPIQNGVDKSWYKNHDHSVDLFTVNSREDWFGYYDHGMDFGVTHIAPWYKIRGKKFFTWGTGPDGLIWGDLLSDKQGPYVEIQSGPFPTQGDFGMLQPHTANAWEAMWYPVRKTGPFVYANEYAALSLNIKPAGKNRKQVTLKLSMNRNIRQAQLQVKRVDNEASLYKKKQNLSVKQTLEESFKADLGTQDLEIKIIDSKGVHLLTYVHSQKKPKSKAKDDKTVPGGFVPASLESTFQSGYTYERYNNVTKALEKYREAIDKDPLFSLPLVEMGRLLIYMGHYEEAVENLSKALKRSPANSDARYYHGVALRRLGHLEEAIGEFQQLSLDNRTAALGYYKLGQIAMMKGDFIGASGLFEEAFRYNPDDIFTEIMVPVSWRKRGRKRGPLKLLQQIKEKDPTNFMVQNEICLLLQKTKGKNAKPAIEEMRKVMRDNPQSYIELAVQYGKIGLKEEAIDVLKKYVKTVKTPDVMLWYYLGYYQRQAGKTTEGNSFYRAASKMKQDYIFPHRLEAYIVLDDAVKVNRKDALAWYALGNMLASRRRVDEAFNRWQICEKLKTDNSVVYRNLGLVLHRARGKSMEALKKYRKAIRLNPQDRELYWELDQVYAKLGMDDERVKLLSSRPKKLQLDMKTNVRLADAYFNLGKFDECIRIMLSQDFWPWEGGRFFRHLYTWSYLFKAEQHLEANEPEQALECVSRAEEYPENIKIRESKSPHSSSLEYYKGLAFEQLGKTREARACWKKGGSEVYSEWILAFSYLGLMKGKCLKKLGQQAKARKTFDAVLASVEKHEGAESAAHYEMKGLCEIEHGQLADAYKSLSHSLELLRSNFSVKKALQKIQKYLSQ